MICGPSHIDGLVICIAQLEPNGLQRNSAARIVIQDVSAVLLMQDAAVPRGHINPGEYASTAGWAQALVVCQRRAVQTY